VIAALHLRVADDVHATARATLRVSTASRGSRRTRTSLKHYVEYSIGTVTALNPVIGYDKATELAARGAWSSAEGIIALVREKTSSRTRRSTRS
jgi:aspartate ammonia-lyase